MKEKEKDCVQVQNDRDVESNKQLLNKQKTNALKI